ncbi:unnamed protein product [Mytilus coruscus]|uniref:Uncharacterized protein n=1 Tax=Mytilus coruscus TaxID=42192 RepID=A0A6J8C5N2_MYTCO|nr:unnamed protein product [Mytilus coruscus]
MQEIPVMTSLTIHSLLQQNNHMLKKHCQKYLPETIQCDQLLTIQNISAAFHQNKQNKQGVPIVLKISSENAGTEAEVRNKYRNMFRGAKEKFTYFRKEMDKTGGGPQPTQLNIAEENIVNAMIDSASFSRLGGIEIDKTCNVFNKQVLLQTEASLHAHSYPTPTTEESVWIRALDRHHSNMLLPNNQQTWPVADHAEGNNRNAACPGPSSSASSQSQTKRSPSSCSKQPTPKKKTTAEDVFSLQCAVLEKELEKNILQIDLLKKIAFQI